MRLGTLSRAVLAATMAPVCAWAGNVVTVPVDVGGMGGPLGSAGAAQTGTGLGLTPSLIPGGAGLAPGLSASPAPQVIVTNPGQARAAVVSQPASSFSPTAAVAHVNDGTPASFQASPAPRSAPQAAPQGAPGLPGALPLADDPTRRTPAGGSGELGAVQTAVKDLGRARKDEAVGRSGAVSGRLDALFDFARPRGAAAVLPAGAQEGALGPAAAAGLPDPKVVGVGTALDKVSMLARGAEAAEAPALYQRALDIAHDGLPPAQAQARAASLEAEAAKRAPAALQTLGEQALAAAAAGQTTDAIRYAKAVHGWDALVGAPGRPYVTNLAQFTGTVKHVLASALDEPGREAAPPKVRFEAVKVAGRDARRARFKFANVADGPVSAVPAGLAANLALPELQGLVPIEGPLVPEGVDLASAFSLRAQAGFPAVYRSLRAEGRGVWSSFWVAARSLAASAAASLWDELKALLVRALEALGVLRAAAPSGLVVTPADPAALAALRRQAPERLALPAAPSGSADGLGLSYRLIDGR